MCVPRRKQVGWHWITVVGIVITALEILYLLYEVKR